jgi:hypothetical protein
MRQLCPPISSISTSWWNGLWICKSSCSIRSHLPLNNSCTFSRMFLSVCLSLFIHAFSFLSYFFLFFSGKGKLMWPFSAQRLQISAPRQLALPTNAGGGGKWKSTDVNRKTVTSIYPDPFFLSYLIFFLAFFILSLSLFSAQLLSWCSIVFVDR